MRRPLTLALASALAATAAAGCNATRRELTVVFSAGTTTDQRAHVLQACGASAPHVSPEPLLTPAGTRGIERTGALVRFRIDSASDRDIARLEACLQQQPGVKGFQDSAA